MTVDVTENAPSETTPALNEPRIVIAHDFESSDNVPQAFRRVVVARTVCNWSAVDKSAAVKSAIRLNDMRISNVIPF